MTDEPTGALVRHLRELVRDPEADATDRELLRRFVALRDEEAFAELVRRHGAMVLGACRSVLRREQDAEDAFQAAFLALAKKAHAIQRPESLAGWLHAVACRLARKLGTGHFEGAAGDLGQVPGAPIAFPGPDSHVLGRLASIQVRRRVSLVVR